MGRIKIKLKSLENIAESDKISAKPIVPVGQKEFLAGLGRRKNYVKHKRMRLSHIHIPDPESNSLPTDFKISYVLRGKVHSVLISSTSLEQTFNNSLHKAFLNE